jgi:hypothetical protein
MDLSDYKYFPQILIAVLLVDVIVIFLVRYFPDLFGSIINAWYDRFGLSAVIADVLIIVLGFLLAQIIYKNYLKPEYGYNPVIFAGLLVLIQIIHDLLFYFGIVQTIPGGHNAMIDFFKRYGESGSFKVILADSAMMLGSFGIASFLASAQPITNIFMGILGAYTVPYILTTRWN